MLYDNRLWIEDIDKALLPVPEIENVPDGSSIFITGATGLICSAIVDILFRFNDTHPDKKIHIYAAGRSMERMRKRFGDMVDRPDFTFISYDATSADNELDISPDYIIHGAGNAYPSLVMKEPVETMLGNFLGLKYLLDFSREKKVKRLLYVSSSEVYGKKEGAEPFREDEYGFVDLLNPRNAYSVGKRAAETLCISYAAEYNTDSVIVRPGHIYGPTATENDSRVSSSWAYDVAYGKDIVLKSDGAQMRSYCYCLDCASAMLKILFCGASGHAYNISNPDSIISIREMAQILAEIAKVDLRMEIPTETEKKGFTPMNNSSLDAKSLLELGWFGCFDALTGFDHTVRLLKESVICH